ncbi:glycosyltransferase family 4 protein [Chloroflexota bacterium]
MKKAPRSIGIIAFPVDKHGELSADTGAGNVPFSHLVDILRSMYRTLYVITGNEQRVLFKKDKRMHLFEVRHRGGTINYILTQIRLALKVFILSRKVGAWVFFIGAEAMMLPALMARLLRRPVILALTGFPAKISSREKTLGYQIIDSLSRQTIRLATRLVAYSPKIIQERNLNRYRRKIVLAQEHFLDFGQFKILKPVIQRGNLVTYIGRLEEGKGIPNLLAAINIIAEHRSDIHFLIGGDGPLRSAVEEYLKQPHLKGKVEYMGWISHEKLPEYLNKAKLLVLPSYTEALPNIILEAMACGTPVLTTGVGAITDVIEDGETGFILPRNSPDAIAEEVVRITDDPRLGRIAEKARNLVRKRYTYESAVRSYRAVFATKPSAVPFRQENPR